MGCGSCTTRGGGLPKGCKNNGSCGTGGCNKLEVFDWLANMRSPASENEPAWVEVRFKNTRKDFFINNHKIPLKLGDVVAVEGSPGHDVGIVSLTGELVKLQMKKLRIDENTHEKKVIYRKARQNDIKRWQDAIAKEDEFMLHCRKVARELGLEMKVSDVECQGDGTKATFYYTAEGRVDFRELIKILARDLKVRIEMRQIGSRQESGRIGGIGVCGRELCCSSWMREFRSVTTMAARYQQLSINTQKLAGQCGKLKCCINFELDSYLDALKDFPKENVKLITKEGEAILQKTDIFRRILYYSYEATPDVLIPLELEIVNQIIQMNQNGIIPEDLAEFLNEEPQKEEVADYSNVIEEESITRFDDQNNHRNKKKKKKKR